MNYHAAPIRLAGYQTIGFQQMAVQCFFDNRIAVTGLFQLVTGKMIIIDHDIQIVDAFAGKGPNMMRGFG